MLEKFISKITESIKKGTLAIFCGAGISYDSGVPTVNKIIPPILEKLGMDKQEKDKVWNSSLPFEAFMQILSENSEKNDFFELLEIFNQGKPNTNHILFAKLAKAGLLKTICTTNFDTLIEQAFEAENQKDSKNKIDYEVFSKEEEFEKIKWNDNKTKIIKIHGCIEDKENMVVVMKRVAAKEYSEQRQTIINQIFSIGKHKDVLILGYSCSDVFDLTLQIENVGRGKEQKNVLFLEHTFPNDKNFGKLENVGIKQEKNPFKDFKNGRRLLCETSRVMKQVWETIIPDQYKHVIHKKDDCTTDKIFAKIKLFLRKIEFCNCLKDKNAGKKEIEKWIKRLTKADKHHISAQILFNISEFENALKYWEKALQAAIRAKDVQGQGTILGNLGSVYLQLRKYQKAIKYYDQALDLKKVEDVRGQGRILDNFGTVYNNLGKYQKAIKYHRQALDIFKRIQDFKEQGGSLGNIGIAYLQIGEFQKAIKYYNQALEITEKIGDIKGQGNWLSNLGIVYTNLGEYQKAIKYHEQALEIAEEIGDVRNQASNLSNLGNAYLQFGECQKAIKYYEQALEISEEIKDIKRKGGDLGNLGSAYLQLGECQKAIEYYEQALEIAEPIKDIRNKGNWFQGLGLVYSNLGKYQKAIKYSEQALKIATKIGDIQGKGSCLSNLGLIYSNLVEYQKAIKYYKQALVIFIPMLGENHPYVKMVKENMEIVRKALLQS